MADSKISALTSYTTPLDADVIPIVDTANVTTKKVSWSDIKTTIKTYTDTLYATIAHNHTGVYAPVLGSDDNYVTDAEKTSIGTIGSKLDASAYDDATSAETNTGTSTAKYVSPDGLAGSYAGIKNIALTLNGTTALTTSEKAYFRIPSALNGMNLVSVSATVGTGASGSSSSGTPTFTVKNVTDSNQMLSTSLTVDANEYTSATAATAAVIDGTKDDVVTDDLIEVAVTTAGTGVTYATVTLGFQLP